jgi:hypothetical protein
MKNKLSDLNNHLFAQLERLSDENVKGDELKAEIERSKAVTSVSREIILTGKLVLDAQRMYDQGNIHKPHEMLEVKDK